MTKTKKITRGVLVACICVCVAWDVFVAWNPIPGDTISEMTLAFVSQNPSVPFLIGYIMGHLFWPQSQPKTGDDHGS